MIAWLNGTLIHKTPQMIILDVNNVGYQIHTPLPTFYSLPDLKSQVSLHIYTHVREDAIQLFGFSNQSERELFTLLLSVSGIGPRLAMTILSGLTPHEFVKAVQEEDIAKLSSLSGIGKKMAGRMVLELKGKISLMAIEHPDSRRVVGGPRQARREISEDVLSALVNLGYNRITIKSKIETLCQVNPGLSLEVLIKESLKLLGKG